MTTQKKDTNDPATPADKNIGERNTAEQAKGMAVAEAKDTPDIAHPPPVPASHGPQEIEIPEPEDEDEDAPELHTVSVTGATAEGTVSFAEVSDRHPDGEAVVLGGETKDIGLTYQASYAISDGRLTHNT